MSILDYQTYTLIDQRSLPVDERIQWTYHLPTFGDTLTAQRAYKLEPDPDMQGQMFGVARVAASLESTKGVLRGRKADEFPAHADMAARTAWVMRLPPSWVIELVQQVEKESDLDQEEERLSSDLCAKDVRVTVSSALSV